MRLLRTEQVLEKLGISRSTLYRLEASGELPSRRRIAANSVGWIEAELDEFIATRPALRGGASEEASR